MKPSVIETGRVINIENDTAKVMIDKGESCKGCGIGKIGLCKPGGSGMIMEVKNLLGAEMGDRVQIGIDKGLHRKGYFILYILPLLSLFLGTVIGQIINNIFEVSSFEVILGFMFLCLSLVFSLKKIHRLDKTEKMFIKTIRDRNP